MEIMKVPSTLTPGQYYFSGNEAAAEGAIAVGCDFYAGYPITPSSEIMERIAERFEELGRSFIQMEDEIGSFSAVVGASWAGAKAMTATSGPGVSLMMEGLGFAVFTETPCVIANIQRAGPSTGQATRVAAGDIMQAKWGSQGDYQIIALSPWSVQEMYEGMIRAFNLAEYYRVPVFLLGEEAVGHLRERLEVGPEVGQVNRRKKPGAPPFGMPEPDGVPPMPVFGERERLLVTGSTHDEQGFRKTEDGRVHQKLVERINRKITDHAEEIVETEQYFLDDADLAVIAYGFTARSALYAVRTLRDEGRRVGLLRLKTLWPFAQRVVEDLNSQVKKALVPEMNSGQMAGEVQKYFRGPLSTLNVMNGEIIHPQTIMDHARRLL